MPPGPPVPTAWSLRRLLEKVVPQSNDLDATRRTDTISLPGQRGQAHSHFVRRVLKLLPMQQEAPHDIIEVDWRGQLPFPRNQGAYLAALAAALPCHEHELAEALADRLPARNPIVVHPCVRRGFADRRLVRAYTQLPGGLVQPCPAP